MEEMLNFNIIEQATVWSEIKYVGFLYVINFLCAFRI